MLRCKNMEIKFENELQVKIADLIWDADECLANGLVDEIKLIDLFNDNN